MDVILRFFFYMEEMRLWVWRAATSAVQKGQQDPPPLTEQI